MDAKTEALRKSMLQAAQSLRSWPVGLRGPFPVGSDEELHTLIHALSAPEGKAEEPVAWLCEDMIFPESGVITDKAHAATRAALPELWKVTPLYTATPPRADQEEIKRLREAMRYIIKQWPDSSAAYHASAALATKRSDADG